MMTAMAFSTRDTMFVLRCSLAATLSYLLADAVGLEYPVWASISAIIVSQDRLSETRQATLWRLVGTLTGIAVAVLSGSPLQWIGLPVPLQLAVAVALCAVIARRFPKIKVCMWTAPVVFLSFLPGSFLPEASLFEAGLCRGGEVLLGGLTGLAVHQIASAMLLVRSRR